MYYLYFLIWNELVMKKAFSRSWWHQPRLKAFHAGTKKDSEKGFSRGWWPETINFTRKRLCVSWIIRSKTPPPPRRGSPRRHAARHRRRLPRRRQVLASRMCWPPVCFLVALVDSGAGRVGRNPCATVGWRRRLRALSPSWRRCPCPSEMPPPEQRGKP
jgi:hypothetical protein